MIVARAPLRISFAGGGSDVPGYYARNPGAVLSMTIKRHVTVSLKHEDRRVTMVSDCDCPRGSGLGGSSSFAVASLAATYRHFGRSWDREHLAEVAYRMERVELGVAGGKQDQYAATFGGFNLIEFYERGVHVVPQPVPKGLVERLFLVWTGNARTDLGLAERKNRAAAEQAIDEQLEALAELAKAMRKLLAAGKLDTFGYLLHEAWVAKRKSSQDHSTDRADLLYQTACKAGALGGKLCGAGGGGYLLLYVEPERRQAVQAAVEPLDAVLEPVEYEPEGVTVQ